MMAYPPRLLFVGYGQAGKDEAGEWFARNTSLTFAGTTSRYLAPYVAQRTGQTVEQAYACRRENRDLWYRIGLEERQKRGAAFFIEEALRHGSVTGGCRELSEVAEAKTRGIVDLIIWVDNCHVEEDWTVEFDARVADYVVENHWSLDEYHERLKALAKFGGVYRGP